MISELPTVVWILIFLAAFLLEWTRLHLLSVVLLGGDYLLAFVAGLFDPCGLIGSGGPPS